MHKRFWVILVFIAICASVIYAQTRLRRRGAEVSITNAGAIALTPLGGQGVAIGGGTAVTKILSATASLNFGATAAGACDALTITLTGAADGNTVALGIPHALVNADAYQSFYGWVSAANTVSVRRCNLTNATTPLSDPAAAVVRATILQF
jgi:hypothetical protein